jgi:hypothetical protein
LWWPFVSLSPPPKAVCTSQRVRNRQRGRLKFAQFSHAIAISAKKPKKFSKGKSPTVPPSLQTLSSTTLQEALIHNGRSLMDET